MKGWGNVGDGTNRITDVLQKAFLPYVENSDCVNKFQPYGIPIYPTYLCAGGHNKTDTCRGDSGKKTN